jgi:hypothetical protein
MEIMQIMSLVIDGQNVHDVHGNVDHRRPSGQLHLLVVGLQTESRHAPGATLGWQRGRVVNEEEGQDEVEVKHLDSSVVAKEVTPSKWGSGVPASRPV